MSKDVTPAEVVDQLAALTRRVAALEGSQPAASPTVEPGALDTDLLERLQQRSGPPFEDGAVQGSVQGSVLAGAATVGGAAYVWQMERPVPGLLATDDDRIADTLAAIASPTRIRLLKAILAGAHETHELQDALGGVSTGQLYHHLRELTAAGLVVLKARGHYVLAPRTVIPVLAIVAAVYDLREGT